MQAWFLGVCHLLGEGVCAFRRTIGTRGSNDIMTDGFGSPPSACTTKKNEPKLLSRCRKRGKKTELRMAKTL